MSTLSESLDDGIAGLIDDALSGKWSRSAEPDADSTGAPLVAAESASGDSDPVANGPGNELIYGSVGSDLLDGEAGNDSLYGLDGADELYGGADHDMIDGGAGNDILDGGAGNDVLYGGAGDDVIRNGAGADVVFGGDGDDSIIGDYFGGPGNADVIYGGAGDDTVSRGSGGTLEDAYYGGDDSDTITFLGSLTNIVHWNLAGNGLETYYSKAGVLDWHKVEIWDDFENYINTTVDSSERVTGTDEANYIETGTGDNSISTLGGDDWIVSGGGNDIVDAGAGNDLIEAGAGHDVIRAGDGDDRIEAGSGNDTLDGGAGADILRGGLGIDTLDYSGATGAVTINMLRRVGKGAEAEGDIFKDIENVIGSDFGDIVSADDLANTIWGGGGKDFLRGRDGDDALYGGDENDILRGEAGADTLDGGGGKDMVFYLTSPTAVDVNLGAGTASGGHATGDVLISIESIRGSFFGDTLTGDAGDNRLDGSGGGDTISGGDGIDIIQGDGGFDILAGGAGADRFAYKDLDWGEDHITDFEDGVDRIDMRGTGLTFADLTIGYNGGSAKIRYVNPGETNNIVLDGIDITTTTIDEADFIF